MAWWSWVLLWFGLVLAAVAVMVLIARRLWRSAVALFREVETASARMAEVSARLDDLAAAAARRRVEDAREPAVFADPTRLRQQRYVDRRRRQRSAR